MKRQRLRTDVLERAVSLERCRSVALLPALCHLQVATKRRTAAVVLSAGLIFSSAEPPKCCQTRYQPNVVYSVLLMPLSSLEPKDPLQVWNFKALPKRGSQEVARQKINLTDISSRV